MFQLKTIFEFIIITFEKSKEPKKGKNEKKTLFPVVNKRLKEMAKGRIKEAQKKRDYLCLNSTNVFCKAAETKGWIPNGIYISALSLLFYSCSLIRREEWNKSIRKKENNSSSSKGPDRSVFGNGKQVDGIHKVTET